MNTSVPTSPRPYLLRAMHEWITDGGLTPHLIVDASVEGVQAPARHVKDGKIVLNISYSAAQGLTMGNEWVEFNARFGGQAQRVRVPLRAALGIYARETGQGMAFSENDLTPAPTKGPGAPGRTDAQDRPDKPDATKPPDGGRARLKVVK